MTRWEDLDQRRKIRVKLKDCDPAAVAAAIGTTTGNPNALVNQIFTGRMVPRVGIHVAFIGYQCIHCSRRIGDGDQCLPLITKKGTNVICDACILFAVAPLECDPNIPTERVEGAIESMQKILCDSN